MATNPGLVNAGDQEPGRGIPSQVPPIGSPGGPAVNVTQAGSQEPGRGVPSQSPPIGTPSATNNYLTNAGGGLGTGAGPNVGQNNVAGQVFGKGLPKNVFV